MAKKELTYVDGRIQLLAGYDASSTNDGRPMVKLRMRVELLTTPPKTVAFDPLVALDGRLFTWAAETLGKLLAPHWSADALLAQDINEAAVLATFEAWERLAENPKLCAAKDGLLTPPIKARFGWYTDRWMKDGEEKTAIKVDRIMVPGPGMKAGNADRAGLRAALHFTASPPPPTARPAASAPATRDGAWALYQKTFGTGPEAGSLFWGLVENIAGTTVNENLDATAWAKVIAEIAKGKGQPVAPPTPAVPAKRATDDDDSDVPF